MARTISTRATRPDRQHIRNIVSRYQRTDDLAPLLALGHDQLRDVELTDDQWFGPIFRWNHLADETRRATRKQCLRRGPRLVSLSARRGCGARVCIACLDYRRPDDGARVTIAGSC